jgi:UDP-glucose 4-epimerase
MAILVTGGAGYIGSHTCLALLEAGWQVIVVDNLSNSSRESLRRVEHLTQKTPAFVELDLLDQTGLARLFSQHPIEAVIHFAGLKAVGESVSKPLLYYQNNVQGSLNLFHAMKEAGVCDLIFSSSATVYGDPETVPINEGARLSPTNPYGQTKLMIENILQDLHRESSSEGKSWRIALLRYFNPVGAHISGQIGEDPNDTPNNLLPYIARVAVGTLKELSVFGSDYPTTDGTGVRDYIHVMDLAEGHLAALRWLQKQDARALCDVFNLGTGKGYSVLDVVKAFEEQSGTGIPYRMVARRPGDIATCFADASKAEKILGWKTRHTLADMMRDTWRWQKNNPNGYR